jgi:hypothetical protein
MKDTLMKKAVELSKVTDRNFYRIVGSPVYNGGAIIIYRKKDWSSPEMICFNVSLKWRTYDLLQKVPNQQRPYGGVCIKNPAI